MADISLARVRLVWSDAETQEEKLGSQLLVDIYVHPDGMPSSSHPAFGIYGSPVADEMYPFLIRPDGTVDYGAYAKVPAERIANCAIHRRRIEVGELVPYVDDFDGEWILRIVSAER